MIRVVVLSPAAKKQLKKVPQHIAGKLALWIESVEVDGLEVVRKIPGYHDEPLEGARKHQRSIRLSKGYRAFYEVRKDAIAFVSVEEVNKHDY